MPESPSWLEEALSLREAALEPRDAKEPFAFYLLLAPFLVPTRTVCPRTTRAVHAESGTWGPGFISASPRTEIRSETLPSTELPPCLRRPPPAGASALLFASFVLREL